MEAICATVPHSSPASWWCDARQASHRFGGSAERERDSMQESCRTKLFQLHLIAATPAQTTASLAHVIEAVPLLTTAPSSNALTASCTVPQMLGWLSYACKQISTILCISLDSQPCLLLTHIIFAEPAPSRAHGLYLRTLPIRSTAHSRRFSAT